TQGGSALGSGLNLGLPDDHGGERDGGAKIPGSLSYRVATRRRSVSRLLDNPVSLPEDTTSSSLLPDNHLHVVSSAIVSAFLSSLLGPERASIRHTLPSLQRDRTPR